MLRNFFGRLPWWLRPVPRTYTPRAQQALALSRRQAALLGHNHCAPVHLLLAVIELDAHCEPRMLSGATISLDDATAAVCSHCSPLPSTLVAMERPFSAEYRRTMDRARNLARRFNHEWLGVQHLWLALLDVPDAVVAAVLASAGLNVTQARVATVNLLEQERKAGLREDVPGAGEKGG